MSKQELDLLEIPAGLPAELYAGAPQIVSPKVLDPYLPRSFRDYSPDRSVAQALPDLATLPD